jgi:hypothetical protein
MASVYPTPGLFSFVTRRVVLAEAIVAIALLSGTVLGAPQALAAQQIICHDVNNQRIETTDPSVCVAKDDPRRMAADRAKKVSVDFRNPKREYLRIEGQWQIFVERDMAQADPALTAKASQKLQQALSAILARMPAHSRPMIEELKYFLMWGEESPLGGMKSGMRAVKDGGHASVPTFDPAWKNAVVIYSARNLMSLDQVWAHGALTHEISHACHLAHWSADHGAITQPWLSAKDGNLYRNVADYKGKTILTGYALANQREYFAELSAMYFVGGNYHPFDKAGLKKYDPAGYQMVEKAWGIQ